MLRLEERKIEFELFKVFINENKDFKILKENKDQTYMTIKPLNSKGKEKKWSYIINFDYGTIRRIVAYKYKGDKKENIVSKFSYYCNQKNRITSKTPYSYTYECHIKIDRHLEMYRKLIQVEKDYKPKYSNNKMKDTELFRYGKTYL